MFPDHRHQLKEQNSRMKPEGVGPLFVSVNVCGPFGNKSGEERNKREKKRGKMIMGGIEDSWDSRNVQAHIQHTFSQYLVSIFYTPGTGSRFENLKM